MVIIEKLINNKMNSRFMPDMKTNIAQDKNTKSV